MDLDPGGENSATITNTFTDGSVHLLKKVTGDVADTYGAGPFTLHMTCVLDDATGTRTVWDGDIVLGGDQPLEASVDQLATGAQCTVKETEDGGATTTTIDPSDPITVGDDEVVTVTATNNFDPGKILLTKDVTGPADKYAPTSFEVEVTCGVDGTVLPGFPTTVTVTAGKTTEVDTLAGSTCTATETDTGAATVVTYDPPGDNPASSGAVDVDPDTGGQITITNDYHAGGLQIVKELDGPGAAIGKGPFVFDVSCDFDGKTGVFTDTVTLKRSGGSDTLKSDPITGLPVGAVCTVTETDNGGADSTPPPVTVSIPDVDDSGLAQVVVAGFVNPFSAARLQITKKVEGTGASAASGKTFTVAVTCEVQTGDATLTTLSTSVRVTGGQTVTVPGGNGEPALVPAGSHCFAKETDDGGADKSSVDHSSYDDAVVAKKGDELATLTITVTNTFDAQPPAPASTGVPVLGLLLFGFGLLLVGGGLVLVTRRRGSMA